MWRTEVNLRCIFWEPSTLFSETISYSDPRLNDWVVQPSIPRVHLSLLPRTEITKATKPSILHGCWGSNLEPEASLAST